MRGSFSPRRFEALLPTLGAVGKLASGVVLNSCFGAIGKSELLYEGAAVLEGLNADLEGLLKAESVLLLKAESVLSALLSGLIAVGEVERARPPIRS